MELLHPGRVLRAQHPSAPFSTFASLKRRGLGLEVVHLGICTFRKNLSVNQESSKSSATIVLAACCSTTYQLAQSLRLSRLSLPLFETERSSGISSIPAAVSQALMPCLTQMGMATVRMRRPLPSRSASSWRLRAQPTGSARKKSVKGN